MTDDEVFEGGGGPVKPTVEKPPTTARVPIDTAAVEEYVRRRDAARVSRRGDPLESKPEEPPAREGDPVEDRKPPSSQSEVQPESQPAEEITLPDRSMNPRQDDPGLLSILNFVAHRMTQGSLPPFDGGDGSEESPFPPARRLLPSGSLVERRRTSVNVYDPSFIADLRWAWRQRHSENLNRNQLSVLIAQLMQETGRGRNVWNNNFGNIKAFRGWNGDYTILNTFENYTYDDLVSNWRNDSRASLPDRFSGARRFRVFSPFRAYGSRREGLFGWISLLSNRRHGGSADFVRNGDANGFGRHIASALDGGTNYGTARAHLYGPAMASLQREWLSNAPQSISGEVDKIDRNRVVSPWMAKGGTSVISRKDE